MPGMHSYRGFTFRLPGRPPVRKDFTVNPPDLEKLHERGELVTVRWPGGPYDFVLEFEAAEPVGAVGWEDWFNISGMQVKPREQWPLGRTFYVRPVEDEPGVYTLVPFDRP